MKIFLKIFGNFFLLTRRSRGIGGAIYVPIKNMISFKYRGKPRFTFF